MGRKVPWLLVGAILVPSAHSYDVVTHSGISDYAVQQSVLNDPGSGILETLCGARSADDRQCLLPSSSPYPNTLTPLRLVAEGAVREDDGDRAVNHFFDPQNRGEPLAYPFGFKLGDPSPDWTLEDRFEVVGQAASLSDARNFLHEALTGASSTEREVALGAAFEVLGHVVHHLQDMAQPQHVRNDVHCDRFFSTLFSPFPLPGICFITGAFRPSAYEGYTKSRGLGLPLSGYEGADFGTFESPRELWSDSGAGIAEFTSNNFVSIGTNFYMERGFVVAEDRHPRPTGAGADLVKRQITDSDLLGPRGFNQPLAGEIWFIGTRVSDQYRASEAINERASSFSIFDSDLEKAGARLIFTMNQFNYAAANEFLLPRAAAYSTGLINYFFRGRIGIALPEEGVYGIVDHATTNAAGQGFGKLKLKLHNASPDGEKPTGELVPQTMHGGTLVAVAKYTLNGCYQPDLSGDFAAKIDTGEVIYPTCPLEQYFAGEEQISQSDVIVAASLEKTPTDFTFDFSSQPIPVNARDLRIQVLYTGQLGAEADGIAFGGRDISEPTHLMVYNNSDYYALNGVFYTPAQIRADEALAARVEGLDIDPDALADVTLAVVPAKPLTGASGAVPVNGYVRVAVLADIDQPFSLSVHAAFERRGSLDATFTEIPASTTDLRGETAFITPLAIYRGPRTNFVDVVFKANNAVELADDALTVMSARDAGDPGPTPIPVRFGSAP